MDDSAAKLIQERFDDLPEDVQRAIQSADVDNAIQAIAQQHKLHVDQIGKLDDETRMVMLGFTEPDAFADQLGTSLNVSPEEADAIAADLSSKLFVPIRESMQKFMDQRVLQAQLTQADRLENAPAAPQPLAQQPARSVVMPSSATIQPAPTPKPVASAPTPAPAPKPAADLTSADRMLSQPTVSMPKPPAPPPVATIAPPAAPQAAPKAPAPVAPASYKVDPYREPPE